MKQAKPAAKVDDILEALECSGKTMEYPLGQGLALPRIDVLGAYNWMRDPPQAKKRTWSFSAVEDEYDWTPFHGIWSANAGKYAPQTPMSGQLASSAANCHKSFILTTKTLRTQPTDASFEYGTAIWFKAKLNYENRTISGYEVVVFPGADGTTDEGSVTLVRRQDLNLIGGASGASQTLCFKDSLPINLNEPLTLKITSDGDSHSIVVNGAVACGATDATYSSGSVVLETTGASSPDTSAGHAFNADSVTINSLDTKPAAIARVLDPLASIPKIPALYTYTLARPRF
jgi:hypothetical protein